MLKTQLTQICHIVCNSATWSGSDDNDDHDFEILVQPWTGGYEDDDGNKSRILNYQANHMLPYCQGFHRYVVVITKRGSDSAKDCQGQENDDDDEDEA